MKNEEHGPSREPSHTVGSPLEALASVVRRVLQCDREALADHRPKWGLADCVDNDGVPYQSEFMGRALDDGRQALAALVAEEQVAGDSSREANETDWKARCEATEQALEGMQEALLFIAETDWHYRRPPAPKPDGGMRGWAGHRAVRALTGLNGSYHGNDDVRAALNPTPQGGKL